MFRIVGFISVSDNLDEPGRVVLHEVVCERSDVLMLEEEDFRQGAERLL